MKKLSIISVALMFGLLLYATPTLAKTKSTDTDDSTLYGALYPLGHLETESGFNKESILMYNPEEEGFVAITNNDNGSEWWTSDALGFTWTKSEDNPLTEYGCTMVGRHSPVLYNDSYYFGANCGEDSIIFELTGLETVEAWYMLNSHDVELGGFPTATVLDDKLFMFTNGGHVIYDGTDWNFVTDAENQPNDVALEVSSEDENGLIYAPFTSGEMTSFDGTDYTIIGTGYLEGVSGLAKGDHANYNLPAVEVYNDSIWVGNQDFENGASLFMYDPEDADEDSELWEEVYQLDKTDTIINKMQLGDDIDGSDFLVFYTSNGEEGTHIYGITPEDDVISLVDSGLGGTNPENNNEVVSVVKRTVSDGKNDKDIMLFGTQNNVDQTKIFGLVLGTDLAFDLTNKTLVGAQRKTVKQKTASSTKTKQLTLRKNKKLKVNIKKKNVNKGDRFILYINGKKVTAKTAKKKKAVLLSKKLKKYDVGDTITVQVGVRRAYGQNNDRIKSTNTILGATKTIKILKKKIKKNS